MKQMPLQLPEWLAYLSDQRCGDGGRAAETAKTAL